MIAADFHTFINGEKSCTHFMNGNIACSWLLRIENDGTINICVTFSKVETVYYVTSAAVLLMFFFFLESFWWLETLIKSALSGNIKGGQIWNASWSETMRPLLNNTFGLNWKEKINKLFSNLYWMVRPRLIKLRIDPSALCGYRERILHSMSSAHILYLHIQLDEPFIEWTNAQVNKHPLESEQPFIVFRVFIMD